MKALVLVVVLIVVCIVLFIAGVIAPRRSKRMEEGVDKLARKGEGKGERDAGRFGDAARTALRGMRHAADASARAGREVNDRITPDD